MLYSLQQTLTGVNTDLHGELTYMLLSDNVYAAREDYKVRHVH